MVIRLNKDFSFEFTVPAGGEYLLDFESDNTTDKHAPFKNVEIHNIGSYAVKTYFNNQSGFKYVRANSLLVRENQSVSYIKFVNTDSSNTVNMIVTCDNDMSQAELLKALVLGREELKK